jgi:predicted TIM-barrel fold metal-dependent hydrolase
MGAVAMWIRKSRKDSLSGQRLPLPTQVVSNEEFHPLPQTDDQRMVEELILSMADEYGRRLGMSRRDFLRTTGGLATAFLAMNRVHGANFRVSEAEALEAAAYAENWPKDQFILDIQTHHVKDEIEGPRAFRRMTGKLGLNPSLLEMAPDKDELHRANYMKEVFFDSDTVMAMISGAVIGKKEHFALDSEQMVETREMLNQAAGSQRMLSHGLADPTDPVWAEDMEYAAESLKVDGWKCYTGNPVSPWRMDDEKVAYPFFEKARELGIRNISVHKGLPLPGPGPKGKPKYYYWTPEDVLVAAKDFPDLNFIIYHSGMRHMVSSLPPGKSGIGEDGNIEWTTDLVRAHKENPLDNVYAELGTVFAFSVVTHPEITGHLLGQLLDGFGPDKILWGTDCIWWGSPQWLIEAFRRFQIPENLREKFGYASLDDEAREKIFGINGAALYDIDIARQREAFPKDELTAMKQAYLDSGAMPSNTSYGWVAA